MQQDPTTLGVDVEDLEMAWELCADSNQPNFSPRAILTMIDDKFFKGPLDTYRAFRLLTSDLGKVFFKPINDHQYKIKTPKSVKASKENWCRDAQDMEWCFV